MPRSNSFMIEPESDLNSILQNGHRFRYNMPQYDMQDVVISVHNIGELIVNSGELLACDLLIVPDSRYSLKKRVKPGKYTVKVSVADFEPTGETRIACSLLEISNEPVISWEAAAINDPDPVDKGERYLYGVDSGTGCFMDVELSNALEPFVWEKTGETYKFEKFCDRARAEMNKNSVGKYGTAQWANIDVTDELGANVIIFSSGWGDGGYRSYWGYDASGNVAALVTDFALFF